MGFIAMKPMGGGLLDDARLAFRFLAQYDNVVADPGIEKPEEIRQIAAIVSGREVLSEDDKIEIEKQRKELAPSWCHRCDYCQPCPQGIVISSVLIYKSAYKRMTPDRAAAFVGPALEKAKTCTACRQCVKRCPYELDIPVLMKEKIAEWSALNA